MLKEREIIDQLRPVLERVLKPVPFINGFELDLETVLEGGRRADFIVDINIGIEKFKLVGEVKSNLQPRLVHDAIRQVREYCSYVIGEPAYPLVVSEYISSRSAEVLTDQNVSYFDLAGNCRLCFDNVYIEREGIKPKSTEQRGVKSLFGLKSSRMLRLMLSDFMHPWHVKQLAAKVELSFGQVSNIRRALLDQGYAMESQEGGVQLTQPGALLNDWGKMYKKNIVKGNNGFYSLLNGDEKHQAIKSAIKQAEQEGAAIMLSGLSSARWLAPFAKSSTEYFYADKQGIEILKRHLMLESVSMGPNVIIEEPKDDFLFKEAAECAPGLKCANAIQTYLDLYIAGEREREAAEHIESYILREKWNNKIKDKI